MSHAHQRVSATGLGGTLPFHAALLTFLAALVGGCQAPPTRGPEGIADTQPTPAAQGAELARRDPLAYLRLSQQRAAMLPRYRLTFYRQERLGLLQTLGKMERILVTFRAQPFSVKFEWPDPTAYLYESIYVAGANDGKLICRERHGFLAFPPMIRRVDPEDSVKWAQSKRPITEFGLAAMMNRTLRTIDDPPLGRPAEITYEGVEIPELTGRPAHRFTILRATTPASPCPRQDLWVDAETQLPAGTVLVLPDKRVDALYFYTDVRPDSSISDEDFRLGRTGEAATERGFGARVPGLGFRVQGSGFRVSGSGVQGLGPGFRVWGLGFWGAAPVTEQRSKKNDEHGTRNDERTASQRFRD